MTLSRRDFLKLPALAAVPVIGMAEAKDETQFRFMPKHSVIIDYEFGSREMDYGHGRYVYASVYVVHPDGEIEQYRAGCPHPWHTGVHNSATVSDSMESIVSSRWNSCDIVETKTGEVLLVRWDAKTVEWTT